MYSTSETMLTPEELKKKTRYYPENLVSMPLKTHIYEVTSTGTLIRKYENWDRDAFSKELFRVHNETVKKAVKHVELKQYIQASQTLGVNVGAILVESLKTMPDTVYAIRLSKPSLWHYERSCDCLLGDYTTEYVHEATLYKTEEEAKEQVTKYYLDNAEIVTLTLKEKS